MNFIDHTTTILKSFDIESKPLDRLFAAYLKRHREIGSAQRRLISDIAFGIMRWRRRIDGLLNLAGIKKIDNRARVLGYLLWQGPEGKENLDYESIRDELGIAKLEDVALSSEFPGGAAAYYSYPDFLYRRFVEAYGNEGAEQISESLNRTTYPVLRINSLYADRAEVVDKLKEEGIESIPTNVSPFGIKLSKRAGVGSTRVFHEGLVEIMDEGSQLAAMLVSAGEGGKVLDVCAGVGGKSLMLAMLMKGDCRIVASDANESKLKELRRRAKRAGISCVEAINLDQLRSRAKLRGQFDVVLVDAPCSGTGTLQRSPDLKWRLSESGIGDLVKSQLSILHEYKDWIKPGGRIVYITCSILPDENERVIENFLRNSDFEVMNPQAFLDEHGVPQSKLIDERGFFRTDPRAGEWDGFFAAVLKKV